VYRLKSSIVGSTANVLSAVWFRNYFDPIEKLAATIEGRKIFEIGSGDGHLYRRLRENVDKLHYTGSDINAHMIEHCRSRYPEVEWLHLDELPYPFEDKAFDIVIIWNVIHHLNRYRDVIGLLNEALRIGSQVILFEPAQSNPQLLRQIKSVYWQITDGGRFYFTHSEWRDVFEKVDAKVTWDIVSEPLNQVYMAEIRKKS